MTEGTIQTRIHDYYVVSVEEESKSIAEASRFEDYVLVLSADTIIRETTDESGFQIFIGAHDDANGDTGHTKQRLLT